MLLSVFWDTLLLLCERYWFSKLDCCRLLYFLFLTTDEFLNNYQLFLLTAYSCPPFIFSCLFFFLLLFTYETYFLIWEYFAHPLPSAFAFQLWVWFLFIFRSSKCYSNQISVLKQLYLCLNLSLNPLKDFPLLSSVGSLEYSEVFFFFLLVLILCLRHSS